MHLALEWGLFPLQQVANRAAEQNIKSLGKFSGKGQLAKKKGKSNDIQMVGTRKVKSWGWWCWRKSLRTLLLQAEPRCKHLCSMLPSFLSSAFVPLRHQAPLPHKQHLFFRKDVNKCIPLKQNWLNILSGRFSKMSEVEGTKTNTAKLEWGEKMFLI